MPNGFRHWAFTLNNYSQEDEDNLGCIVPIQSNDVSYVIYGKEVATTGTPHLQGHVYVTRQHSLRKIKNVLAIEAHFTPVRDVQRSIDYCKKDGTYREFGVPPHRAGSNKGLLEAFRATIASGITNRKELRETHPSVMARYPRFAESVIRDFAEGVPVPDDTLRDWQSRVVAILDQPPHKRRICFVVDPLGNAGKTHLANWIEAKYEHVQVMKPGKFADMAYEYDIDTKVLIVDIPRSKCEHFQYSFLECVKDGRLFSSKYESITKRFVSPHVLVFMNQQPDDQVLSRDRYQIELTLNNPLSDPIVDDDISV